MAVASLVSPTPAKAGGAVVPLDGDADPSVLDVRVAVAVGPQGTTRWSAITIPDATRALWLVPARPRATIAWAPDSWLASLEEATAPRILRPSFSRSCIDQSAPERTTPWTITATKRQPQTYAVHPTAESVRSSAAADGFTIAPDLDARIGELYAAGWNLVALQVESTVGSASSGTLRVSDDGGSVLPLALTGTRSADTRVTAFTIGSGVATTNGARDIDGGGLLWGNTGSNFVAWRRDTLANGRGNLWLRECASHAALFDGTIVTDSSPAPSVATQYLGAASCATSAKSSGNSDGVVGDTLATSTFGCSGLDDLAIALDGLTPRSAVVTRWAGIVPRGALGVDRPISFDANAYQSPPVVRAGAYDVCTETSTPPGRPIGPGVSGGTSDTTTSPTSDDGCGGDTTTTSSDDGWDSSDSSDSCGSDSSSSSSSSDSCGGGSSDSGGGSDDGWDTEDDMSPKAKKQSLKLQPKHSRSPFSRYALFAVALILPLRRRARAALER